MTMAGSIAKGDLGKRGAIFLALAITARRALANWVTDWHSRYILDWELSPTLDADFCIETVGRLLQHKRCEIFKSDQGSQFTSLRTQSAPALLHGDAFGEVAWLVDVGAEQ